MSARRSTRLLSKASTSKLVAESPPLDGDYDEAFIEDPCESEPEDRPKKRRKNAPKKATTSTTTFPLSRKNKGKLRQLPEMPLDVLFEIFGHLNPLDLLHLARTTKSLRNLLMRRSSISVWKESFSTLPNPLPPCPPDLSEPAYANLAFDPHCHFCLASSVHSVMWVFRVRCCQKCISQNFVEHSKIYSKLNGIPRGYECVPYSTHRVKERSYHWPRDLYRESDADAIQQGYLEHQDNECFAFLQGQILSVSQLHKHAKLCEDWLYERHSNRKHELEEIRQRRKEAIFKKLAEIGWGEEVQKLNELDPTLLATHQMIKQPPKDLTIRAWDKIRPGLEQLLEDSKRQRLERERRALHEARQRTWAATYKEYASNRPPNDIMPTSFEVYESCGLKEIIEAPSGVEVTSASFAECIEKLPELSKTWREEKDRLLLSLLPKSGSGYKEPSESRLYLATTFFTCSCNLPISYPRVLMHSCLRSVPYCPGRMYPGPEPWSFDNRVNFNLPAFKAAETIVKACGFNAEMVTAREMDEKDCWLECLSCKASDLEGAARFGMPWRKAVYHSLRACPKRQFSPFPAGYYDPSMLWVRLTDDEVIKARRVERRTYEGNAYAGRTFHCCSKCRVRFQINEIESHLRKEHQIYEATEEDYYLDIDASEDRPWFSVKFTEAVETQAEAPVADLFRTLFTSQTSGLVDFHPQASIPGMFRPGQASQPLLSQSNAEQGASASGSSS